MCSNTQKGEAEGTGLVQPREEKASGWIYWCLPLPHHGIQMGRVRLLWARGDGHKLEYAKFWLDTRGEFNIREVKYCNWLTREVGGISVLGSVHNLM